jgi:hypothetical protein
MERLSQRLQNANELYQTDPSKQMFSHNGEPFDVLKPIESFNFFILQYNDRLPADEKRKRFIEIQY